MSGLTSTPSSLEALPLLGDIPLELWDWNPLMPLPRLPGSERPPPPAELSQREAQIWRDIVDARPLHYFGRETWPMLAALCTHAAQAELLAAELRRNSTQKNRDEHRKQTAMIATLSTRLRLSKLGQRKHQSSEEREASGAPRRRLWQVT